MDEQKKRALSAIDENASLFTALSDEIWGYAELSLNETRSCKAFVTALKDAGFLVESPFCGLETAFLASFGQGKPVIGILAEYDALSGLSQESGALSRKPLSDSDSGHGCGHHLLGAGAFAAAYALKRYLQRTGKSGTVRLYGCPGEEGGAAKAWFAKNGVWRELDAALTWHPDDCNMVASGSCLACIQTEFRFAGVASHAAGSPELGRSALDAVELTNIGVQYLREHMPSTARIHYAVTDGGGASPNVVQPHARVLYMVRDVSVQSAITLNARVLKIAEAAAMMTETTLTSVFIDGCANVVPNGALEALMQQNFGQILLPTYTEEERAFAAALKQTYPCDGLPGGSALSDPAVRQMIEETTGGGTRALNDFLIPHVSSAAVQPGSTDVGDVSWQTPTAQIYALTFPSRCPGHSWQNVSVGKSGLAHKGMLLAGKVLCAAAIDLFQTPTLLEAAKAEFLSRTKAGYACPIPDGETIKAID